MFSNPFSNLDALKALALDSGGIPSEACSDAIEDLTRRGDFSILPELQAKEAAMTWDGPIGDGMEGIAYQFGRHTKAVQMMTEAAQRAREAANTN
jgi:hypothetical protein